MGRLIDADTFTREIVNLSDLRTLSTKTIGKAIKNTPTAYDVDKVLEQLEKYYYEHGGMLDYYETIKIVKKGG